MSNPVQVENFKKRLDLICSLIAPVRNYLLKNEKVGDATKATVHGDIETKRIQDAMKEEFMNATAGLHQWGYDENNLPVRIVNGKAIRINEEKMKELVENRKKLERKQGPRLKNNNEQEK